MQAPTEDIFKILTGYMLRVRQGKRPQKYADASVRLEGSIFDLPVNPENCDSHSSLLGRWRKQVILEYW